jgi:hypothetical protein
MTVAPLRPDGFHITAVDVSKDHEMRICFGHIILRKESAFRATSHHGPNAPQLVIRRYSSGER